MMTKKLVMVETLSQFLIRYVIEVEGDNNEAVEEVEKRQNDIEFNEFSQKHLGSLILSNREITEEEYLKLFNQDNDYLRSWNDEQKNKFINRINYEG